MNDAEPIYETLTLRVPRMPNENKATEWDWQALIDSAHPVFVTGECASLACWAGAELDEQQEGGEVQEPMHVEAPPIPASANYPPGAEHDPRAPYEQEGGD